MCKEEQPGSAAPLLHLCSCLPNRHQPTAPTSSLLEVLLPEILKITSEKLPQIVRKIGPFNDDFKQKLNRTLIAPPLNKDFFTNALPSVMINCMQKIVAKHGGKMEIAWNREFIPNQAA